MSLKDLIINIFINCIIIIIINSYILMTLIKSTYNQQWNSSVHDADYKSTV